MSLRALLRARIAQSGPMPVADFMALCLGHPQLGYYATRDPFGRGGDFVTAPEISQMFGELVGLALAQAWIDRGRPDPFALVELGPGRGSLMADLWRATAQVSGFHTAARLHLVETSPALRQAQAKLLAAAMAAYPARTRPADGPVWCASLEEVATLPLFLLANEFFDALPIRQYVRTERGWCERQLGLSGEDLAWGLSPPRPLDMPGRPGAVLEHAPQGEAIAGEIGRRLAADGGAALVIDYGAWEGLGDTLQAVAGHRPVDPLAAPGMADLTAHVRFGALAAAAVEAGARVAGFSEQGAWLEALGLRQRSAALSRAAPDRAAEIASQFARLTETGPTDLGTGMGMETGIGTGMGTGMGQLIKVLGLTANTACGASPNPGPNPGRDPGRDRDPNPDPARSPSSGPEAARNASLGLPGFTAPETGR
ncbi:MAG: SAM-dependent methyltransferase [Pseudomonadota bacterium]